MATAGVQLKGSSAEAGAGADLPALVNLIEARLSGLIPAAPAGENRVLFQAAATALLGRGKRARPILSMLACAHVGGRAHDAVDYGCAVEIVHAASLVLDDLPCMDDAVMRRGAAAVHVAHGEDAAVLVSIALLNQAHCTVLRAALPIEQRLALLEELTTAVGFEGLAHGQMRDLRDAPDQRTEGGLRRLNHLKTGGLIVAALKGGGVIGGAAAGQLEALTRFGECIGFAFQLCDDLLDATGTAAELGKDIGQDRDKLTFVDLWGVGRVQAAIRQAVERAEDALGDDCPLSDYVRGLLLNASVLR
ncbi:MAG: polyprenyl synthetase family protein [Brevundimonas sp.]